VAARATHDTQVAQVAGISLQRRRGGAGDARRKSP
jgi:hypothetical protein